MSNNPEFLTSIQTDYPDFLRDESRREGTADSISFPCSEEEIQNHLRKAYVANIPVTVQGARTGITAGAVPSGGHIMNLSKMTKIIGYRTDDVSKSRFVTVQPGMLLTDLQNAVAPSFFPPDPTEDSASIGGMIACNASGARSFQYGATRKYVERLRVVLADGSILDLKRGRDVSDGRTFSVKTTDGRSITGQLPCYKMPDVKNAAGYFVQDNMDLVDLFIGAEGTLGVISEVELRLMSLPAVIWGVTVFFPTEESAVNFVDIVRSQNDGPVAIEFFDANSLNLLRQQKKENPAFAELPTLPDTACTAVYVEYHGSDETSVETSVMKMSEVMLEFGGDEDATWLASDQRELARLKNFRHAIPESVNLLIDGRRKKEPRLTKLGTDLAVPNEYLKEILISYHSDLKERGLEYVIFGHIGDSHLHVNILPHDLAQYEQGKKLYLSWAEKAVGMGGTVSAEHGIGKLKKDLFKQMYGEKGLDQMRALKHSFDPSGTLNDGNLF